ncbi:unnamed protein product [Closterium sp. NIES-53]
MNAEMASWKYTGTYVDEVPPPGTNIVDGMWIFRVKRPPCSSPAFKARYVARGFSQRQGVDFFQTFSPTPKMTTVQVLLHVAAQRDYKLHSLDFSTAFLQGSLHEEIWLRHPPGFTGSFPAGTQWSLRRPVYGLRQAPREWHNTLRTTVPALGFAPSTADPSSFLRTDTSLQPFYVLVYVDNLVFATADTEALTLLKSELQKRHTCTDLGELRSYLGLEITRDRARRTITMTQSHMVHQVLQRFGFQFSSPQPTPLSTSHSLSAPRSDESVEPSGPYPELVGWLMYLMTCTRPYLAYPLSLLACYVAAVRRAWGLWLEDGVLLSSLVTQTLLGSSCEADIYAGAMAAEELRWLTYLLTDLGEQPRSPPVLYVDNKAMIALCPEHRLEHQTKYIALRYFLARDLQQCGQLRLAYVATRAKTADIFTKALPPACFDFLDWSCDHLGAAQLGLVLVPNSFIVYSFSCIILTISEAGVEIDPKKLDMVKAWHPPTNITRLQSFLGFVDYVRRFVPDMARLTAPLTDLLWKGVVFTWGEKEHAAFSTLKNVLYSPPVLRIADPHRPFEVVIDASDNAISAVLLQDFGNGLQPIAYESRKLHPPEKN